MKIKSLIALSLLSAMSTCVASNSFEDDDPELQHALLESANEAQDSDLARAIALSLRAHKPTPNVNREIDQQDQDLDLAKAIELSLTISKAPQPVQEDPYTAFVRQFEAQEKIKGRLGGIHIPAKDLPHAIRLFKSRVKTLQEQIPQMRGLCEVYDTYKRTVPPMDVNPQSVHQFNLEFLIYKSDRVFETEQRLIGSRRDLSLSAIEQMLKQSLTPQKFASIQKPLEQLRIYLKNPLDQQSQLNMAHMVSQVFDLMLRCHPDRDRFQLPNNAVVTPLDYFIYSLNENFDTAGGCKPGMAGRLFRDYLLFSSAILSLREKDAQGQIQLYTRHLQDLK